MKITARQIYSVIILYVCMYVCMYESMFVCTCVEFFFFVVRIGTSQSVLAWRISPYVSVKVPECIPEIRVRIDLKSRNHWSLWGRLRHCGASPAISGCGTCVGGCSSILYWSREGMKDIWSEVERECKNEKKKTEIEKGNYTYIHVCGYGYMPSFFCVYVYVVI